MNFLRALCGQVDKREKIDGRGNIYLVWEVLPAWYQALYNQIIDYFTELNKVYLNHY